MPQQHLQQRLGLVGEADQCLGTGDCQQVRDVRRLTDEWAGDRPGHPLVGRVGEGWLELQAHPSRLLRGQLDEVAPDEERQVLAEEGPQVLEEVLAHRVAHAVRRRDASGLEHGREIHARVVGAPDPWRHERRRSPHHVAQPHEQVAERVDGALVDPAVERGHRQHAVGLPTDPEDGQRTAGPDVLGGVVPRPLQARRGEPGAVEADHLGEEVAPRRRPQRPRHRPGGRLVLLGSSRRVPEGGHPEGRLGPGGVAPRGRVAREQLLVEAAVVLRVGRLVRRTSGLGVVGRRPGGQERQAVGEVVRVELGGHVVGAVTVAGPQHEQHVHAGEWGGSAAAPSRPPRRGRSRPSSASPRRRPGTSSSMVTSASRSGPIARSRWMSRPVPTATAAPPAYAVATQRSGSSRTRGVRATAVGSPRSGNDGVPPGRSPGLVGVRARTTHAARSGPSRPASIRQASRSLVSSASACHCSSQ